MSDDIPVPNKRNNRKRKKSFLKNARKYGKKGYYGRGSQLDSDTYQYFIRIMETYREGFENEEDKIVFANNVFEQTENQEINCSSNQVGCRVIEMLLPFANDNVMKRYMEAFSNEIRPLCSDRFASHVLEALVKQTCEKSLKTLGSADTSETYTQFTIKISKFLLNNLEDYMWDTYGNHIIRTCLRSLSQVSNDTNGSDINFKPLNIPNDYSEIVREYGERIINWPQFNELCNSELTSGFLQDLLRSLKNVDVKLMKLYMKKLLKEIFAAKTLNGEQDCIDVLPPAFLSTSVLMLLETALQLSKPRMFSKFYQNCFAGRLVKLASTRSTNFAVQKLLTCCTEKSDFELIFEELVDHLDDIIQAGHMGVILCIAQACKRLSSKQGSFVQSMMKILNCSEPEERQMHFLLCLCRMVKFEDCKGTESLHKEKLNLHGTLIIQVMLDYNKPIKIINSLLSLENNDLKNLFMNSMGSHITDSFVKGLFVGERSREKLIKKLSGTYQDLAASKYGSRSFEALWSVANLKDKLKIMEELSYKEGSWSNSEYGKIIAGKVNIVLFKRNKEDWKNFLNNTKTDKILAEILK
ncbi:unnamed protein product [Phaedon cochleariae]|uniref:Nucleolar protein 9 n=1 Tax=Phaedon cochleariae TaxID=80249 RepID=A0A9P0DDM3_PHACE|nr:unnamed protein product [Phaedon cochleariae]